MSSAAWHLIAALIGAMVAGLAGTLFVPDLFWGLLVGGAMTGGAISVARTIFGAGGE